MPRFGCKSEQPMVEASEYGPKSSVHWIAPVALSRP